MFIKHAAIKDNKKKKLEVNEMSVDFVVKESMKSIAMYR